MALPNLTLDTNQSVSSISNESLRVATGGNASAAFWADSGTVSGAPSSNMVYYLAGGAVLVVLAIVFLRR